ncbi:uncharacterized protein METZ01_LOCUS142512 [marine metagenome]|uniref:Uncharacterized protein n=1 Tax=marine metagenome TaxID=408172 RepID=A0A381ZJX9_9ZZZZ
MELGSLSIKAIVIIVATFTGGDGHDQYVFDTPVFKTKEQCTNYVRNNFDALNAHVNKNYNYRLESPNLFYCIDKETFDSKISGVKI